MMFEGKKILITGGTGSLGNALTKKLLEQGVEQIRIFSRNELKQIEMESRFKDNRLRFLIGDIRDLPRLIRATEDVDIVFHAAALKHVPKVEYNPFESIKTNVQGSQNVIDACLETNVERAVCLSTDKAVSPLNTYGATKLLMEKLFVTALRYSNPVKHRTRFFVVRYGNVFGSSGSVVPKFIEQIKNKEKITITDPNMTRFNITMDNALDFILKATQEGKGSEIFVPKLKSYVLSDIKDVLNEILQKTDEEVIGIRPGEKLHEVLINQEEMRYCWDLEKKFMISNPAIKDEQVIRSYNSKIKKNSNLDSYTSENTEKLSSEEIKKLVLEFENKV